MPKGTPKVKVVSINAFEQLQERFTGLQNRYDSLLQRSSSESYLRENRTRLIEHNNILTIRNEGLCIALAICGNRIANLDDKLVDVNAELSEFYCKNRNEINDSAEDSNTNYIGESLDQIEPSNPPIQPTTKTTIKPKPNKSKQKLRRKK